MSLPIVSIEAFKEWLAKKDPNAKYDWNATRQCAIAQYVDGLRVDHLYLPVSELKVPGYEDLEDAAYTRPWTFGAFLTRLS